MCSMTKCNADGYGAASFDTSDGWHNLEIQVGPESLKVYISSHAAYRARRAVWVGREAGIIGAALCDGMHPGLLADWCDENTPTDRDWDFDPAKWLRTAVVTVADLEPLPF